MAPTEAEWAALSPEARARVVAALPASMTDAEASPPEGDLHYDGKNDVRETLRTWFTRLGQSVYVTASLTVYYAGQPRFAPDVLAVREVSVHDRMKWVVSDEGKGLDWVMEVHVGGARTHGSGTRERRSETRERRSETRGCACRRARRGARGACALASRRVTRDKLSS